MFVIPVCRTTAALPCLRIAFNATHVKFLTYLLTYLDAKVNEVNQKIESAIKKKINN